MGKNQTIQIGSVLARGRAKLLARIEGPNSENKKHYLIETALLFGLLMIVNYLFLDGGLNEIAPHPFWIPIVLISFQYGIYAGLVTALVATVLAYIVGWGPQAAHEDHYQYLLRVWFNPALWLGAAIILGEMRQRHLRDHERIEEQLVQFTKERQVTSQYCIKLQSEMALLEHRIAMDNTGASGHLLDHLDQVRKLNEHSFNTDLQHIIDGLFGPVSFKLEGIDSPGNRVTLAQFSVPAKSENSNHNIHRRVDRGLSMLEQINPEALADNARLACPLRDNRSGRTIGVLELDLQDADKITKTNKQIFRVLCMELENLMSEGQMASMSGKLPDHVWSQLENSKSANENNWGKNTDQNNES